ncbi:hypothetical protein Tco_0704173, partial [Tanacetum coccineum]
VSVESVNKPEGITGLVYHDLYLGGKALVERENVGFDLTKSDLCSSFVEDHTAKGVGLRVANSHTDPFRARSGGLRAGEEGTKEELFEFLSAYPVPSGYKVMLPKRNQTIFNAPDGYVGLYTHCFSLANLRFPLPKFFCDVLQYFKLHLSRLNPFGCAKLTTFAVICWKGRFFFVQDSIVLIDCPELLSKDNRWDTKSFKDKLPDMIHENPNCSDYGTNILSMFETFPDPTCFLAEMAFKNFMFTEDDEDLSFLPKDLSPSFGTGSPSVSINTELPLVEAEPLDGVVTEQLVENFADSGGSPVHQEKLVTHHGSVAARIKDMKCRTRGSLKPPVKRRSPRYAELLDLHDRCYARQAVMDNAVNRRAQELLKIIEQMRGECEVLKEREKAREKECEELRPNSKVASLEAEKAKLEVSELSLRQEVEDVKRDRAEVVSKVVPYMAMELVHNDELGRLVGKLASSSIFYGRCAAFEEVAKMKEPFDLSKVKGYRSSYKKEHMKAGNDLATATFPLLSEVVVDPSAPIKVLLSKKPQSLQHPAPTRILAPTPSTPSTQVTPATTLVSKPLSPFPVT